jgi:hypothetical protein
VAAEQETPLNRGFPVEASCLRRTPRFCLWFEGKLPVLTSVNSTQPDFFFKNIAMANITAIDTAKNNTPNVAYLPYSK